MQVQEPLFKVEGVRILFSKDVMKKGLNFTVRHGGKYAEERGIQVGAIVHLMTTDEAMIADAEVTHLIVCRLKDVPKDVLSNEHDPDCHNPFCLYDVLVHIYPDVEWDANTLVTCIGFNIL